MGNCTCEKPVEPERCKCNTGVPARWPERESNERYYIVTDTGETYFKDSWGGLTRVD